MNTPHQMGEIEALTRTVKALEERLENDEERWRALNLSHRRLKALVEYSEVKKRPQLTEAELSIQGKKLSRQLQKTHLRFKKCVVLLWRNGIGCTLHNYVASDGSITTTFPPAEIIRHTIRSYRSGTPINFSLFDKHVKNG